MPLFQVDIEKELGGEYWTNRYVVSAATLLEAATVGDSIVTIERNIHRTNVLFTKMRAADFVPGNDQFVIHTINGYGDLDIVAGQMLPLFNVLRVDFNTSIGRPSRKYLRLPLYEGDIIDAAFNPGFLTTMDTEYCANMLLLAAFVDVDGQQFLSASAMPKVAMRQLRRGSRRRTQPVLP